MFEFSPIQWLLIGIVASVVGFAALVIGACVVSGWWSRLDEKSENCMKVENWKATPERLAMTKRTH